MRDIEILHQRTQSTAFLRIAELIKTEDMLAKATKVFRYRVYRFGRTYKPNPWFEQPRQKKIRIYKNSNSITGLGEMKYICLGSFFVVQGKEVFTVSFLHSITFNMMCLNHVKEKV